MVNTGFMPNMALEYLFLDLNSYFASVEQQENPRLRGRPIAVVPMMTDATCAIAASYEAKAYGVKTGTKIFEAKRLCPDLICVLARHDVYVDYHHRIFDEIDLHIPIEKIASVDEALCRLQPHDRNPDSAAKMARHLKQVITDTVGPYVKCSIGMAPNGFLAKTASDMQKPDGLTILEPDNLKSPLCTLKLTDLTGINVNMERRLNRGGIYTVEDFWNLSPKHARKIWGGVGGERFWYNLHGYKIPDQKTQKRVIGHSRILDPELRPPEQAAQVARQLTYKAAARLRRYDMYCGRFSLSVKTPERRGWYRDITFSSTQDSFKILGRFQQLWREMISDFRPRVLRKVSVSLTDLTDTSQRTPDLFDDYISTYEISSRPSRDLRLCRAIDMLNRDFGANTVTIGMAPQTRAGFVGTKIAFNRIPDREEFWE